MSLKIAIFGDMENYENRKKEKMFNQKLFQITNILALLNKKAEIQNFVILQLKVGHHFNIYCN